MDIHKPKPWHGAREFLKEYVIIVVGVLTALGAEQIAEAEHWHHKVEVVRTSLQGELANNRARWELDVSSIHCVSREIDALDAWESGGSAGAPPPTPGLADELLLWMHNTNWNLATASQSLDHFPMSEQLAYAAMYAGIANRQEFMERATASFGRINALRLAGNDAQTRRELRVSLGELREQVSALLGDDNYMRRHFDDLGVRADSSDVSPEVVRDPTSGCFRTRKSLEGH
jgi:hypothetical protein